MPHRDIPEHWTAGPADRQAGLEVLDAAAAGAALPYPFDDALRLAEALCRPPDWPRTPAAPRGLWILLCLTWRREARRMGRPGGEGTDGGGGGAGLPVRGMPA